MRTPRRLDLEQPSLALWSGVHGLACLLIDGALGVADPTSVVDATVATVIAGVPRRNRR